MMGRSFQSENLDAVSASAARAAHGSAPAELAELFDAHRDLLWGICYRMTGSTVDADDLVQDTFVTALRKPPPDTDAPWKPWLVKVAMNLCRDQLRRRRRASYVGPWLPAPVETALDEGVLPTLEIAIKGIGSTEGRYDLLESVSYAFLVALEELTPQQRAVLLLRDVFDYSVRDTMEALDLTQPSVKTTLHRARRRMRDYDDTNGRTTGDLAARTSAVLSQMLEHLANADVDAIESMLAEDVRAISDGGGEFHAARRPVLGRRNVARFYVGIASKRGSYGSLEVRTINGLPAIVASYRQAPSGQALRMVQRIDLDSDGKIASAHTILATAKLASIRFPEF